MRGILSVAGYLPRHRLQLSEVTDLFGSGGGKGSRSVASFDEDTTTMGVAAARMALRSRPGIRPDVAWLASGNPPYLDRTNATALHAALCLERSAGAYDAGASVRASVGLLHGALTGSGVHLVVGADLRTGRPTSVEESAAGDAAAAIVVGDDEDGPVLAHCIGSATITEEFLDRWRVPGETASHTWEDRFGESRYVPVGEAAWRAALASATLDPGDVDRVVVAGLHDRAAVRLGRRLGVGDDVVIDELRGVVGNAGVAHPLLALADVLERCGPGRTVALAVLADGADVFLFRTTEVATDPGTRAPTVGDQIAVARDVGYGKFLAWRGMVTPEPPNRPPPERPSSAAASRTGEWKFGLVGGRDRSTASLHLPPARTSMAGERAVDDMEAAPMADALGTVVTSTVDRLVHSQSPPVVFAVIDFDGGGRAALELTDCRPEDVDTGTRVEMTFRRMFTSSDGIHNYFWKARPVSAVASGEEA